MSEFDAVPAADVPDDETYGISGDLVLEAAYYADLVVEGKVLVELKAVDQLLPIHAMQVVTYLKLARIPVGLLINFNVPRLTTGLKRFVNSQALEPSPQVLTKSA